MAGGGGGSRERASFRCLGGDLFQQCVNLIDMTVWLFSFFSSMSRLRGLHPLRAPVLLLWPVCWGGGCEPAATSVLYIERWAGGRAGSRKVCMQRCGVFPVCFVDICRRRLLLCVRDDCRRCRKASFLTPSFLVEAITIKAVPASSDLPIMTILKPMSRSGHGTLEHSNVHIAID